MKPPFSPFLWRYRHEMIRDGRVHTVVCEPTTNYWWVWLAAYWRRATVCGPYDQIAVEYIRVED